MRYFLFSFYAFSTHCQQPPDISHALQKPVDLIQAIAKLKEHYQQSINTHFEAIQTHILQKTEATQDISQTDFGRIIDRENDAIIANHLDKMTQFLKEMHTLEDKLKKADSALMQNPQNLLELWSEHEIEQQIESVQKDLFESIMQLSYRQTIRTHQKASEIRGAVVKITQN